MARFLQYLVIFIISFESLITTDAFDSNSNNEDDSLSSYAEVAADLLQDPNVQNLGGMVNNFIQSENGKQIGDMLMGSINKEAAAQTILQGLGSMLNQKDGKGIDPTLVQDILGSVMKSERDTNDDSTTKKADNNVNLQMLGNLASNFLNGGTKKEGKMDIMSLIGTFGSLFNKGEGKSGESLLSALPNILSMMSSGGGGGNNKKLLPSILEMIYELVGTFVNSESGKNLMNMIFGKKVVSSLADEEGKFSAARTMELLQNHSFRRHWIEMITKRVAKVVAYFADPETQNTFVKTVQLVVNNMLNKYDFPKAARFDPERPEETITAVVNYIAKKYFNTKVNAKQYVKPAVEYVRELLRIGQKKGLFGSGINSNEFSDKLADTLNLEIIEPVIRVYRAYQFVKRHPKCDKYVFCLINQENPNNPISLPGLKKGLSRTTSLMVSWFITKHTGSSFWSIYDIITEDKHNCKSYYLPACNNFHVEEEKVTTEYFHNEL